MLGKNCKILPQKGKLIFKMKLTIIIPTYNEAKTIRSVINKVKKVRLDGLVTKEIIVVNDGSTDGTTDILKEYENKNEFKILHIPCNKGKSEALRLGIAHSSGDFVLIQDADLEYDPDNYAELLKPALEEKALIVFGSRFLGTVNKMNPLIRIANKLSNMTVNFLFKTHLTDVNTCYKLFKSELLKQMQITSNGFVCDSEITCQLLKKGYAIIEVPIRYSARTKKEGKKMNWFEAIKMYLGLILYSKN